ncbi:hypothetical protein EDD17DRAFT_1574414 [Pisolithus thermaeus]|nr:hypothetical protein EDD17DRAFT_1574414 [Pisolithus thermaeus]
MHLWARVVFYCDSRTNSGCPTTRQVTIGVDCRVHRMEVDGGRAKLSIWDTTGQESFRKVT